MDNSGRSGRGRIRLALLIAGGLFGALPPAAGAPLTREARAEDPRLRAKVSISADGVYIGELLEKLSASTGVRLSTGRDDGSADVVLDVRLDNVPLGDAMDALWSLVSYRRGPWHWQCERGKDGAWRYRLTRPRRAQLLSSVLRQDTEDAFMEHARALIAAATDDGFGNAPSDPVSRTAADLVRRYPRTRAGLQLFSKTFDSVQQERILRGQEMVHVPVERLPAGGREFVDGIYQQMRPMTRDANGSLVPLPPPTSVTFYARTMQGDLARCLFIAPEGLGGYGYAGGTPLERRIHDALRTEWLMPGDTPGHLLCDRTASEPPADGSRVQTPGLGERLAELGRAVPLSYLARLPSYRTRDPGSPAGMTVRQFMDRATRFNSNLMRKWRSEVLLVSHAEAALEGGGSGPPPLEVLRELRERVKKLGAVDLATLAWAASRLSDSQMIRLREEFPALAVGAGWRPLLRVFASSPQAARALRSARGVPVAAVAPALVEEPAFEQALLGGQARSVRIDEALQAAGDRLVRVILLDARGRPVAVSAFRLPAAKRDPPGDGPAGRDAGPKQDRTSASP